MDFEDFGDIENFEDLKKFEDLNFRKYNDKKYNNRFSGLENPRRIRSDRGPFGFLGRRGGRHGRRQRGRDFLAGLKHFEKIGPAAKKNDPRRFLDRRRIWTHWGSGFLSKT